MNRFAFQIHVFVPDVCWHFHSVCVKEVNNSLPCQFSNERQMFLGAPAQTELSLYQGTGQCMSVLSLTCCGARRHRPPGGSIPSGKDRSLLLMELTFSFREQGLSQVCVILCFGEKIGSNLERIYTSRSWIHMRRTRKKYKSNGKGQRKLVKKRLCTITENPSILTALVIFVLTCSPHLFHLAQYLVLMCTRDCECDRLPSWGPQDPCLTSLFVLFL